MRALEYGGPAIVVLVLGIVTARGAQHTTDSVAQVKARVHDKTAVLIDVREKAEWNQGHLEGALLVPLSELTEWDRDGIPPAERARLDKAIPKGAILYCHCRSGGRAVPAGEILRRLGFDARPLREGYRDLLDAGFPKSKK